MSGLVTVGYFLFSMIFSLITFVLWMRIALRYFKVSALQPMSQVINRFTDPVVIPIGHLIHTPMTRKSQYDWPAFTLLVLVEIIKFMLVSLFFFSTFLPWFLIVIYIICDLIIVPCNLLFYAILIRVIMSWVNPNWHNPFANLLILVTEPTLRIARRAIPYVAGIDLSPFVVLLVLKVITLFIGVSLPFHLI